jgi:hypothetical protein
MQRRFGGVVDKRFTAVEWLTVPTTVDERYSDALSRTKSGQEIEMNIDNRDLFTVACSLFGLFTGGLLWVLFGGAGIELGPGVLWGFGGVVVGSPIGTKVSAEI